MRRVRWDRLAHVMALASLNATAGTRAKVSPYMRFDQARQEAATTHLDLTHRASSRSAYVDIYNLSIAANTLRFSITDHSHDCP